MYVDQDLNEWSLKNIMPVAFMQRPKPVNSLKCILIILTIEKG